MKIAICCETESAEGLVAVNFKAAPYLLLVDADKRTVYDVIKKQDDENLLFAAKIVDEDCEAVITGPIEKEPFEIIAGAGVSRFDGAGHKAQRAFIRFLRNQLTLIRDYIGGPGAVGHSHDLSCECDEEEEDTDALSEAIDKVAGKGKEREDTLFMLSEEDAELLPDELEIPDGLTRDEIEELIRAHVESSFK